MNFADKKNKELTKLKYQKSFYEYIDDKEKAQKVEKKYEKKKENAADEVEKQYVRNICKEVGFLSSEAREDHALHKELADKYAKKMQQILVSVSENFQKVINSSNWGNTALNFVNDDPDNTLTYGIDRISSFSDTVELDQNFRDHLLFSSRHYDVFSPTNQKQYLYKEIAELRHPKVFHKSADFVLSTDVDQIVKAAATFTNNSELVAKTVGYIRVKTDAGSRLHPFYSKSIVLLQKLPRDGTWFPLHRLNLGKISRQTANKWKNKMQELFAELQKINLFLKVCSPACFLVCQDSVVYHCTEYIISNQKSGDHTNLKWIESFFSQCEADTDEFELMKSYSISASVGGRNDLPRTPLRFLAANTFTAVGLSEKYILTYVFTEPTKPLSQRFFAFAENAKKQSTIPEIAAIYQLSNARVCDIVPHVSEKGNYFQSPDESCTLFVMEPKEKKQELCSLYEFMGLHPGDRQECAYALLHTIQDFVKHTKTVLKTLRPSNILVWKQSSVTQPIILQNGTITITSFNNNAYNFVFTDFSDWQLTGRSEKSDDETMWNGPAQELDALFETSYELFFSKL